MARFDRRRAPEGRLEARAAERALLAVHGARRHAAAGPKRYPPGSRGSRASRGLRGLRGRSAGLSRALRSPGSGAVAH